MLKKCPFFHFSPLPLRKFVHTNGSVSIIIFLCTCAFCRHLRLHLELPDNPLKPKPAVPNLFRNKNSVAQIHIWSETFGRHPLFCFSIHFSSIQA